MAEDRDCDEQDVEKEVRSILEEMGHKMFLPAVRFIALLLRPFIRSALHGVYVNREGLEQVNMREEEQWFEAFVCVYTSTCVRVCVCVCVCVCTCTHMCMHKCALV